MKHSIQHQLDHQHAKSVLDRAMDTYRQHYAEYNVETCWLDEHTAEIGFELTGQKVGGKIEVGVDRYDIHLELPWMLRFFERRIVDSFDQEFQRWLDRA